ncbi:sensor histidine kinase [Streptomyces lydicus]|uniref:sensor histidine kinase n=1 Tax=Streptomyces lydicus TaxID=47763 RepID=UPI0036EC2B54
MDATTPPPAARTPVTWHSWWLMPLALSAGTVATAVAGPDQVQIPATFGGAVAAAASAVCVRLLVRAQSQLSRVRGDARTSQAEHSRQWENHVEDLKRQFAEQSQAYEAGIADLGKGYERGIAERTRAMEEQLTRQQAVVGRLGDMHLPEAFRRLREGEAIDDILVEVGQEPDSPELRAALRTVLRTALINVQEQLDRSTSAEQAVVSIGSRLHVRTGMLRARLHEMQGEHGRLPAVAQGLMELDQEIGPADCLAASISVLGGSDRPGRQWQEPQRLLSVVRGGIGRIKDFDRIQIQHLPELGVDGGLVDHLTLIFAHLLDNAARYSPPTEAVVLSGKEVPNGVGIEIQDAGKGLSEEKKREVEQSLLGTAAGPGLGGISEDANLGLRVVGALARRYGIRVTVADSPWLGTSVVVVVPHKYFSPLAVTDPAPTPMPTAAAEPDPVQTASIESAGVVDTTPGGLPRRRGRRSETSAPRSLPLERTEEAVAVVPPDTSFTGLAAFATAGRKSNPPRATTADRTPATGGEGVAEREFMHRTEESD